MGIFFFLLVLAKKKYIWDTAYRSFDARFDSNAYAFFYQKNKKGKKRKKKANLI